MSDNLIATYRLLRSWLMLHGEKTQVSGLTHTGCAEEHLPVDCVLERRSRDARTRVSGMCRKRAHDVVALPHTVDSAGSALCRVQLIYAERVCETQSWPHVAYSGDSLVLRLAASISKIG